VNRRRAATATLREVVSAFLLQGPLDGGRARFALLGLGRLLAGTALSVCSRGPLA